MMTIGDLIKNKDYDYVEYRISLPEVMAKEDSIFAGAFSVKAGKIISKDGDSYTPDEEVLNYEEWSEEDIPKGLTVVCKRNCIPVN